LTLAVLPASAISAAVPPATCSCGLKYRRHGGYDIDSNQTPRRPSARSVGWQFSGVGIQRQSRRNERLLRNNKTAGGSYDIRNKPITGAAFIGTLASMAKFAGIPRSRGGASDLVLRNIIRQFEVSLSRATAFRGCSLGTRGLGLAAWRLRRRPSNVSGRHMRRSLRPINSCSNGWCAAMQLMFR